MRLFSRPHHLGSVGPSGARRELLRTGLGLSAGLALSACGASDAPALLAVGDLPVRLRTVLSQAGIPGALVRVQTPQGVYEDALGVANRDTLEPMDMSLSYRIGSNTKPMVAYIVLQLVAEGRIALDDPVSQYFDDPAFPFPFGDAITIRMLGNMTSGLRSYETRDDVLEALVQGRSDWTTRELIEFAFAIVDRPDAPNPQFEPGTRFQYANINTVILGDIACRLTGLSLDRLLEERLFVPLSMVSTYVPLGAGFLAPHLRGYTRQLSEDGTLTDATLLHPGWTNAAGIVISTHKDMARWLPALARGDGLPEFLKAERLIGLVDPRTPARYGFGHFRFGEWFGHNGLVFGYSSYHVANTRTGALISVVCNADYASQAEEDEASTVVLREVVGALFPGTDDGFLQA